MAMIPVRHPLLFYVRRASGMILLLALSAVFLFSAWSKLQTIQPFEWSFLDLAPLSMTGAAIAARLFIGGEVLIGLFLLAHIYLNAFTYKATLVLLSLLSLYLILLLVREGNSGSCGCFGEWIYMKPLTALWKNLGMMAVTVVLMYWYPVKPYSQQPLLGATLGMIALVVPFVLSPLYITGPVAKVREPLNLDPLYQYSLPAPTQDLRRGKHILAYLSTTCPHCKKAAYLLQILHRQYPEFPVFMILNGDKALEASFLEETRSVTLPHTLMEQSAAFGSMAGRYVPAIYWVNNGVIERKTFYNELEPEAIRAWLKE